METPDSLKRTNILLFILIAKWKICFKRLVIFKDLFQRQAGSLRISLFVGGHFLRIEYAQKYPICQLKLTFKNASLSFPIAKDFDKFG